MRFAASAVLLGGVIALTGCETPTSSGLDLASNFALGSTLNAALPPEDQAQLTGAFVAAMRSEEDRATASWVGASGRASGDVVARQISLGNILADPAQTLSAPAGLAAADLELDDGLYEAAAAANVRLAPEPLGALALTLIAGARVQAIGWAGADSDWLLAAIDEKIIGYIYKPQLQPIAEPGALAMVNGEQRTPTYCRAFTQRMDIGRRSDIWMGSACLTDDGAWRLDADSFTIDSI